jgi:hypothetical protein
MNIREENKKNKAKKSEVEEWHYQKVSSSNTILILASSLGPND